MKADDKMLELIDKSILEYYKKIEECYREIARLQAQKEKMEVEKANKEKLLINTIICRLPRRARNLFDEIGVKSDKMLFKFLDGEHREIDVAKKGSLYFYDYKRATTREGRLQAVYGLGPKVAKEILGIISEMTVNC